MSKDEKDYTGVLLEDIRDQNRAVLEAVGAMQDQVKKIPKIAEGVEKLEYDMSAVKLAVKLTNEDLKLVKIRTEQIEVIKDHSRQLEEHEAQIKQLKTKIA